jgi:hypothetical protein
MSSSGFCSAPPREVHLIAHYLPQYHPIPENDLWWGKGFTEWTNVTRARPLFKGHQQPHLPADLGFYDLRVPEVRRQQAKLAREAGIGAFCYYHYWFGGRRLLERPFEEVLASGEPDFPFCLCWANEPWSRNWDGLNHDVLMPQSHSTEDDIAHIEWLIRAFHDKRYFKVDGRPVFLVYRPSKIPHMRETAELWRSRAIRAGFPDLYLCSVQGFIEELKHPSEFGMDAAVEFKPNLTDSGPRLWSADPLEIGYRLHNVWDYNALVERSLETPAPDYTFFRAVCPSWDNSARRRRGGTIYRDASPEKYQHWLEETCYREHFRQDGPSLVFVNAWNEWAEGNHLEPCQRWGHCYLDATRSALNNARSRAMATAAYEGQIVTPTTDREVRCSLDSISRDDANTVTTTGWCFWHPQNEPPSFLTFGAATGDNSFRVLPGRAIPTLPRPDVAAAFSAESALRSGFNARIALNGHAPEGKLALLAFDEKSQEFGFAAWL